MKPLLPMKDNRTKTFDIYKWQHKDRKHQIETFKDNTPIFIFEMGFHHQINPETYSIRAINKVQKQLRQYLYNHLDENNYPTNSYMLMLDAPSNVKGDTTYINLKMACPLLSDMEENKAFCNEIVDKMYSLLG